MKMRLVIVILSVTFLLCFTSCRAENLSKITYVSNADGKNNIYTINIDGTGKKQLTKGNGNNTYPSWSPDGIKITFTSESKW